MFPHGQCWRSLLQPLVCQCPVSSSSLTTVLGYLEQPRQGKSPFPSFLLILMNERREGRKKGHIYMHHKSNVIMKIIQFYMACKSVFYFPLLFCPFTSFLLVCLGSPFKYLLKSNKKKIKIKMFLFFVLPGVCV